MFAKRTTHHAARIVAGIALSFAAALPARADFIIDIFQSSGTISTWADALATIDESPDFSSVASVIDFYDGYATDRGLFEGFSAFPGEVGDNFVMRARASFTLAEAATVTFAVGSDDGSMLSVNGSNLFTDQDPLHWYELRGGTIDLAAGSHTLELVFFEEFKNAEVEFMYALGNVPQQFDPETGDRANFGMWEARTGIPQYFDLVGSTLPGTDTNVGLQLQPVPVPGALWLLASALAPLGLRGRRRAIQR